MPIRTSALLGATAACAFLTAAPAALALGLTVNSAADTGDTTAGDGTCGSALPNTCTLRAAIQEANGNAAAANVITFSVAGPTNVITALPAITKPVSIDGGTSGYAIDGQTVASLLRFTGSGGSYTLNKLTLRNGVTSAAAGGGGVYFAPVGVASLAMTNVTLTGNEASAGPGGGLAAELLANGSEIHLTGVTVSSNTASGSGGGIWVRNGETAPSLTAMSLDDSVVTGNTAASGGGINVRRGRLNIGNTTVSANTASGDGDGIFLEKEDATSGGSIRMDNSTVSGGAGAIVAGRDGIAVGTGNPAASWITFSTITNNDVGIRAAAPATNFPGDLSNPFTSNIVAANTTNCSVAFAHSDVANSGFNLTNGASCGFTQSSDQVVATAADAKLAGLASNPSAPQTHALTAASPAIDAGNPGWSTGADQRGADAQDGGADGTPGDSPAVRDIGAYEYGGYGLVQFSAANFDVDEDSGPALVLIKRYGTGTAATSAPAVSYSTATIANEAKQGNCSTTTDYDAVDGPITANPMPFTFSGSPGTTQFELTAEMTICDELQEEADAATEQFSIALADASGGDAVGFDFGPNKTGTVTIHDTENGTFQFNPLTYAAAEGNTGSNGSATLTITRTGGSHGAVRVNYASRSGAACDGPDCTATEGTDYTAVNTFVDFADGESSKTITVNFIGDGAYESGANETFEVTLGSVSCQGLASGQTCDARLNATAANLIADVTINNDDTAVPGTLRLEAVTYQALEASGTLAVKVKRVGGSDGAVSVSYGSTDGTATAGVAGDYFLDQVNPHTVTWADNDAADKTITVSLVNDVAVESNKTFTLSLVGTPTGGATLDPAFDDAAVTLVSDEQPAFQFADTTVSTNEGTAAALQITWTAFTGGPVEIGYYTVDGTAVSPMDYTGIPQGTPTTLTISSGDAASKGNVSIATATDTAAEGNEGFSVTLNAPTGGATLGAGNPAAVDIIDPAGVRFTSATFTRANEQNGQTITATVERTGDTSAPLSVDFAISQNCDAPPCATQGTDYTRSGGFTGTLSWAGTASNSGESPTKTFSFTVIGDTVIEGDEGVKLTLSNAVNNPPSGTAAQLGTPSTATAVIPDDDYRFEIVETSPLAVGESGGTATVTVRRFGSTLGAASVNYATADGTAAAPGDYTAATGTLNWAAGTGGTQTVDVAIAGDALDEANEDFSFTLSTPSNNVIGEATAISGSPLSVQVTDDDTAGVMVTQSGGTTDVAEGGATDTYTVVLTSQPTADVTITVTGDADVGGAPATLTFTPADWGTAQAVTVTAVDDLVAEGAHSGTLTHAATSGDGTYDGIAVASVSATVTDNDTAGVTVTQSGGTTDVAEGGATDTYTVVLTSQPTADVTISVTGDADVGGSPATLTFTAADWNAPQTVTVTAVDDTMYEGGAHSGTLTHGATSADATYDGIAVAPVTASIAENDAPPAGDDGGALSSGALLGLLALAGLRRRRRDLAA